MLKYLKRLQIFSVITALLSLFCFNSANAQFSVAPAMVAILKGKCHSLIFSGSDATKFCEPSILNMAYKSGKSSFTFTVKDKAVIGFFGSDSKAQGDTAVLRVESITINLMMGTPSTSTPATGTCRYSNPYAGPALIRCSAVSGKRVFEAIFVSDGSEPESKVF